LSYRFIALFYLLMEGDADKFIWTSSDLNRVNLLRLRWVHFSFDSLHCTSI